jgi:hypothetical protein
LALDFDGIDDTVQLKRRVELPSDMTFVCSLEFDQFNRMISGSTDQYIAYFSSNTSWFFRTSVAFYQTLFPAFIASRTYDIALTRSGSDLTFWRDGKIIASRSGVLGSTSMEVLSGWSSTTQFRLNGRIGNTSIYNRALSPQEIQELYVDSLAPFRRKAKPIGYQPNKELRGLFKV